MTVKSLKKSLAGTFSLELNDGTSIPLKAEYLPEEILSGGDFYSKFKEAGEYEPGPGEEEVFRHAADCYRAEKTALRLIARSEQYSRGLIFKLESRGFSAGTAKTVVYGLIDRNLLDDLRYAELWVNSHRKKTKSPGWLMAGLRKKGIDADTAAKALKKALDPETEYSMLLNYLDSSGKKEPTLEKGFLRAKLKNEGFSHSAIGRYFDEIE